MWPQDTFVDFDGSLNHAVQKLRDAFGDSAQTPRYIETVPRRGYRLIARVRPITANIPTVTTQKFPIRRIAWYLVVSCTALVLVTATIAGFLRVPRKRAMALTERDEVVLADLVNNTGEPIFDDTLRTAIAVKLEESPFLNTVSEARINKAYERMGRRREEKLVGPISRELCQRVNAKALVTTSISKLGAGYVITLEGEDCLTGETLARAQTTANNKDAVLRTAGTATATLREHLGESIKSIRSFDTPLYEATTPSLNALRSYSLGRECQRTGKFVEAIEFYQRAIELDNNFALAYGSLGACNFNIGEVDRALAYFRKAFELREYVSERERYRIVATFYQLVTGELNKALSTYELYTQAYPRDPVAHGQLSSIYATLGTWDKALAESRTALELSESAATYDNYAAHLIAANRYDEAGSVMHRAMENNLVTPNSYARLYGLAFLHGNSAEMNKWARRAEGTSAEAATVFEQAQAKAFMGQLRQARSLYRQAARISLARKTDQGGHGWRDQEALVEAEFGNLSRARAVLAETHSSSATAAMTRALTGDFAGAESIARNIATKSPVATIPQEVHLPVIRATIELGRNRPTPALDALQNAMPYRLRGFTIPYLRGYAHLRSNAAEDAVTDFQTILDHRGIALTSPIYPLAYIGLARALARSGDAARARKGYEQFFTIWKDADPDIPILEQAKAEYMKLQTTSAKL